MAENYKHLYEQMVWTDSIMNLLKEQTNEITTAVNIGGNDNERNRIESC